MTSLIFGAIYMTHKGATGAYREKQRQKAYERWEGLRDEYDEQKKITRETRSLDIQRTGAGDYPQIDDRPPMTLRDLQEANDARTAWRPQESWESSTVLPAQAHSPPTIQPQRSHSQDQRQLVDPSGRSVSIPSAYWAGRGEIRPQKTGATWDEGLPAPLKVSRRSFDDRSLTSSYDERNHSISSTTRTSLEIGEHTTPLQRQQVPPPVVAGPSSHQQTPHTISAAAPNLAQPPAPMSDALYNMLPVENHTPGGPMAQLIEGGY